MKQAEIAFWQKERAACEEFMKPHHKRWRRLLKAYRMEFDQMRGMEDKRTYRISRYYPLTRQIIASIAFNYPQVFMKLENSKAPEIAEIYSRIANDSFELSDLKAHMHQALFDALYCYMGWIKYGVNPPGDGDLVPPYVANDAMENGMPFGMRVDPFKIYVDPITPPTTHKYARYMWEKMLVPYEMAKADERFANRKQLTPLSDEEVEEHQMLDMTQETELEDEERNGMQMSKDNGKFVELYEVHDRIHKKLIIFAKGVEQPLLEEPHPFLAGRTTLESDPFTGEQRMAGFEPTGGYLVEGGFPYWPIRFDITSESLYGLPMMEYVEDEQEVIVESVSRRMDLLKRYPRILLGQISEREENEDVADRIEEGKDGTVIWVKDVHNSFAELGGGQPPQDQLGIESDMRQYEEQVLNVSQLSLGSGGRKTATESALIASFGQLNREWLQGAVSKAYEVAAYNFLRMMSDIRYSPENYLVNIAPDGQEPVYEAITADLLKYRFKVHIEAGSMRPLFEEIEKEDALALFNYIIRMPETNRPEAIKMLLRTFRTPPATIQKLFPVGNPSEVRCAQLENEWMAMQQRDPGVLLEQDHNVHMQTHQQFMQDPIVQQIVQANPAAGPALQQLIQQHMAQHQQALQARAQQAAGMGGGGGNINKTRDSTPLGSVGRATQGIQSQVRSNAQEISQAGASINRGQN